MELLHIKFVAATKTSSSYSVLYVMEGDCRAKDNGTANTLSATNDAGSGGMP